jgi:hypothetical protein
LVIVDPEHIVFNKLMKGWTCPPHWSIRECWRSFKWWNNGNLEK